MAYRLIRVILPLLFLLIVPEQLVGGAPTHIKTTATPNTVTGTLSAVDANGSTLSVRTPKGSEYHYGVSAKTVMMKDKRFVAISAFKPGDTVVVRFKRSSGAVTTLYDLVDGRSWDWLCKVRRQITQVTIIEVDDGTLKCTVEPDAVPMEYRVTQKTQWTKQGKSVDPSAFIAGDKPYISPRLLPSGMIMAVAVADTTDSGAQGKERAASTVTGVVTAYDVSKRVLSLRTKAGDQREAPLAPECVVKRSARIVTVILLKPGASITVHLKRGSDGERMATLITIHDAQTVKTKHKGTL